MTTPILLRGGGRHCNTNRNAFTSNSGDWRLAAYKKMYGFPSRHSCGVLTRIGGDGATILSCRGREPDQSGHGQQKL